MSNAINQTMDQLELAGYYSELSTVEAASLSIFEELAIIDNYINTQKSNNHLIVESNIDYHTSQIIQELLSVSNLKSKSTTSRIGMNLRKLGRVYALNLPTNLVAQYVIASSSITAGVSATTVVGTLMTSPAFLAVALVTQLLVIGNFLAEAGIIPTTEKHAFIRFQGLVDMHAKRISGRLRSTRVSSNISDIRIKFTNDLSSIKNTNAIPALFAEFVSDELVEIVSGYIDVMKINSTSEDKVDDIISDFTNMKTSFIKGSGVWNRIKSGYVGLFAGAFVPAFSFISQYQLLSTKNPKMKLIAVAQRKLDKIYKK